MRKKKLGLNIQGGFWFFFRIIPNGSREQIWTTSSISSVGIIKLSILHDFPCINMARSLLNDARQNKRCRSGPSFPPSDKGSETGGTANSLVQACTSLVKPCEQLAIATSSNQNSSTHGASTYESIKVTFKDGHDDMIFMQAIYPSLRLRSMWPSLTVDMTTVTLVVVARQTRRSKVA